MHWLCHTNYYGWIWIKVSCGGVVDSVWVAVDFSLILWRDSCQLWDIFYIFGSNSEQSMQYLHKKYNGKSSRTLWSMNHRVMVVKSLDNSFYMLLDPTPWQAKTSSECFFNSSPYIWICVYLLPSIRWWTFMVFLLDPKHQQLIWNSSEVVRHRLRFWPPHTIINVWD